MFFTDERGAKFFLKETALAAPLGPDSAFDIVLLSRTFILSLNGNTVLDTSWSIPASVEIPAAGSLAFGVEKGKVSFDDLMAYRRFGTNRNFGAAAILNQKTDAAGGTTTFNSEGDIVKGEDPAHALVKDYEIEKSATGSLKRKKETLSVTAKNAQGQDVTT